ncbi:hypothetical protein [uncultured Thermosynechococcus sp.]|uniref:hypothetical protein n=1 Tax=uncultured Thermosynechococcus sp. TaxID=436945 RepID=UPI002603631F|nr:hypothetical protein [uncultured Thermosynechococcus sp.]
MSQMLPFPLCPKIKETLLEEHVVSQAALLVSANGYMLDVTFDFLWQRVQEFISYLLGALCLALPLSLFLSLIGYWFSVTFGIPVLPFVLIVV